MLNKVAIKEEKGCFSFEYKGELYSTGDTGAWLWKIEEKEQLAIFHLLFKEEFDLNCSHQEQQRRISAALNIINQENPSCKYCGSSQCKSPLDPYAECPNPYDA